MAKKPEQDGMSQIIPSQDVVVIFESLCSIVEFDDKMEQVVYSLQNADLYDFEKMEDPSTYHKNFYNEMKAFKESGLPIMLMTYLPPLAMGLDVLMDIMKETKTPHTVTCIAFFHNDKETKQLKLPGIKDMLEFKNTILDSIEEFPFIKKFNIPLGFKISRDYIYKLLREMV